MTCVPGEFVSCEDLFCAIRTGGFTREVCLTLDCCYSGVWCHTARDLYEKSTYPFRDFSEIEIQTSTDSVHKAAWGEWSSLGYPTNKGSNDYRKKYGMTYWINDEEVQEFKGAEEE